MEWTWMLVVSLRGVNFGFWSRLGCSGQNVITFSRQGLFKGCTQRKNKTERILILYIYSIHINKVFRTINILTKFLCLLFYKSEYETRRNWSLLGVCISFGHAQIGLF